MCSSKINAAKNNLLISNRRHIFTLESRFQELISINSYFFSGQNSLCRPLDSESKVFRLFHNVNHWNVINSVSCWRSRWRAFTNEYDAWQSWSRIYRSFCGRNVSQDDRLRDIISSRQLLAWIMEYNGCGRCYMCHIQLLLQILVSVNILNGNSLNVTTWTALLS